MNETTIEVFGAKVPVHVEEADAMAAFELAMVGYFPPGIRAPGLTEMGLYDSVDPIDAPLPKPVPSDSWDRKDDAIRWVRTNFTPGMLAKLYKLAYDADGLRRDRVDEIIRKG